MGKSTNDQANELRENLMNVGDESQNDISYINKTQNQLGISLQEFKDDGNKFKQSIMEQSDIEEQKNNNQVLDNAGQSANIQILDQLTQTQDENNNVMINNQLNSNTISNPINFNINEQNNGKDNPKSDLGLSGLGGSNSNEVQRDPSMLEVNVLKLQNSRVSYQDLDELHEDLLDERQQNDEDEQSGCLSKLSNCFQPKQKHSDNWLKHFKLLVKNNRFIENNWSGGLFDLINNRFSKCQNIDSEQQQELHKNAQITLDDQKLKRESSTQANSSKRTTLDYRQNSKQSNSKSLSTEIGRDSQQGDVLIAKEIKQVIQNSVILEEDIESLRESLRNEQIMAQFEQYDDGNGNEKSMEYYHHNQINNIDDLQTREYPATSAQIRQGDVKESSVSQISKTNKLQTEEKPSTNRPSKMEILGRSIDIVTQQGKPDQKPPKVKVDSKFKNRIRSSSLKRRAMLNQSVSRNTSEKRSPSFLPNSNSNNDSRFDDSMVVEEVGDDALGLSSNQIKTNTLLINSELLQEKDYELYQAVVYYKTITFVMEQHLVEENNFTQEKPLRVIRDNFIEYYVRQYGQNLQRLEESEIIDSIQDLKEFVTLYLEILREYYKLDELVDKCTYADRFITTDNLINFLCSILFQDDAVYSIVYVSHCHFEHKLSLKYFKNVKQLHQTIDLDLLKVNEEYCLNDKTLIKLQKKMGTNNCSINDTNVMKGFNFKPPFQKAFEHFKTIAFQRSPVHKLKVIIKTQDLINECIKDFYEYFGIDYTDIYYDADNLVGIFSYILIKSEVYDIIAHCKIIENFATKNTLNSHSGYLLVTLQCCIRFISSINVPILLNQNRLELNKL